MAKYKLTIEYDGTPYCGWQRQSQLPTVQEALERAITSFCRHPVVLFTAGRTDTGVHATGQVAHCELDREWATDRVRDAINAHLMLGRHPISVLSVTRVDDTFHARFSACKRHYLYKIVNRRSPVALHANRVWWVPKTLNARRMHEAAQTLIGYHDFTTFRSTQCQAKSPCRHLDRLDVSQNGELIEIRAQAPSFLHNQVRSLVGTLKEVGLGRWTAEDVRKALEARDRRFCGPVAPPFGLYLTKVDYD